MKHDYTSVKNIYIICGKTDMRKGIDGLATLIQDSFELDPYGDSIFLFSGWSKDRYKCLYFDGDGFAMLYKRLDSGKLQWPKDEVEPSPLFRDRSLAADYLLFHLHHFHIFTPTVSSYVVVDEALGSSSNSSSYTLAHYQARRPSINRHKNFKQPFCQTFCETRFFGSSQRTEPNYYI